MNKPLLETKGLVSGYGKSVILRGVSILVNEGNLVAIVGPNGSGKTTLIKSIYGLAKVFESSVFYEGKEITKLPPHQLTELGLSYMPQMDNVFPSLTIEENLEMGAYIRNDRSAVQKDVKEILKLFPVLEERRT